MLSTANKSQILRGFNVFKMLVTFPLPRKNQRSYQHIAHVTLEDEEANEVIEQMEDLKAEFNGLKVVSSNLP